jgi:hypothetical protein
MLKRCVEQLTLITGIRCVYDVRNISRRNEIKSVGETYYLRKNQDVEVGEIGPLALPFEI